MEEQLITFETAKLAKKKGFNPFKLDEKLTQAIISNGDYLYIDTSIISTTSYSFYKEDDNKAELYEMRTGEVSSRYGRFNTVVDNYFGKETSANYYHAPTQSLLQKWLREKHNIFIQINVNFNVRIYYKDELYDEIFTFHSYEGALEKGLQESLKLI